MAKDKDGYETERFAVENVRLSDGDTVRVCECYGEGLAKAWVAAANAALPDGYGSRMIRL